MTRDDYIRILEETEALQCGHFLLSSGRHAGRYFQCAKVLQHPGQAERVCAPIADHYRAQRPTVTIGPAIGGIVIAQEVGRLAGTRAIFAERESGRMTLRRGFEITPGEKVLVVEDVITTGGSVAEVIELVKRMGGDIVGAGVIVDRSGGKVDLGVPLFSLIQLEVESYPAEECPFCKDGTPVSKPGSRNRDSL